MKGTLQKKRSSNERPESTTHASKEAYITRSGKGAMDQPGAALAAVMTRHVGGVPILTSLISSDALLWLAAASIDVEVCRVPVLREESHFVTKG
jgi:hypothetical protein